MMIIAKTRTRIIYRSKTDGNNIITQQDNTDYSKHEPDNDNDDNNNNNN